MISLADDCCRLANDNVHDDVYGMTTILMVTAVDTGAVTFTCSDGN